MAMIFSKGLGGGSGESKGGYRYYGLNAMKVDILLSRSCGSASRPLRPNSFTLYELAKARRSGKSFNEARIWN